MEGSILNGRQIYSVAQYNYHDFQWLSELDLALNKHNNYDDISINFAIFYYFKHATGA